MDSRFHTWPRTVSVIDRATRESTLYAGERRLKPLSEADQGICLVGAGLFGGSTPPRRLAGQRSGTSGGVVVSVTRILSAFDRSIPLAFLAALGTLRLLCMERQQSSPMMKWVRAGVWHPEIFGADDSDDVLCLELCKAAKNHLPVTTLSQMLGNNITVDKSKFTAFAQRAFEATRSGNGEIGDFVTAFGCEVCEQDGKNRIEYSDLCFITGSGHEHFLGTMKGLAENVTPMRIRDALFGPWTSNKGLSMCWDPADEAEYAFRWAILVKQGLRPCGVQTC